MNSDQDTEILQSIIQYYRAKCSKLEYEFLLYKTKTEQLFKQYNSTSTEKNVTNAETN